MTTHEDLGETSATVIDRAEHSISRRRIPENVLKVLYRLHRSGYRAYLCGGSVRDLLMNRPPKDFEVATDAHPMEIRRMRDRGHVEVLRRPVHQQIAHAAAARSEEHTSELQS